MIWTVICFAFDLLKAGFAPLIAFLIFTHFQEPFRTSRLNFEIYRSWLEVLPSEIERLRLESSAQISTLRQNAASLKIIPVHITTVITSEFLSAARIPMMVHFRAKHIVPKINEAIQEITETLAHISRYNEGAARFTNGDQISASITNVCLSFDRLINALNNLERQISDESALCESIRPRLGRV